MFFDRQTFDKVTSLFPRNNDSVIDIGFADMIYLVKPSLAAYFEKEFDCEADYD